jgi:hypothetical protein
MTIVPKFFWLKLTLVETPITPDKIQEKIILALEYMA